VAHAAPRDAAAPKRPGKKLLTSSPGLRPSAMSATRSLTVSARTQKAPTGEWLVRRRSSSGYGKAQNLWRRLRAAYDQALADVDLLLLPTCRARRRSCRGRPRRGRSSSPRRWRPSSTRRPSISPGILRCRAPAAPSMACRSHDAGRPSFRGEDHLSGSSGARTLGRRADPQPTRRNGDVGGEPLDSDAKRQAL